MCSGAEEEEAQGKTVAKKDGKKLEDKAFKMLRHAAKLVDKSVIADMLKKL